MASGKRASMREGPLAQLFRKTEDEGSAEAPRVPTPQDRLRAAFSSDIPENVMAPPARDPYARETYAPVPVPPPAPAVMKTMSDPRRAALILS